MLKLDLKALVPAVANQMTLRAGVETTIKGLLHK
jgi:hypothetical protein